MKTKYKYKKEQIFYLERWESMSFNEILKSGKKFPECKFYVSQEFDGWYFLAKNKNECKYIIENELICVDDMEEASVSIQEISLEGI